MRKWNLLLILSVFVLLFLVGCTTTGETTPPKKQPTITETALELEKELEKSDWEKMLEDLEWTKKFEETHRPQRDTYGIPLEVFEELPPIPDDFGTMQYLLKIGKWQDLDYFTEAYYKQPEFYPFFKEAALRWWLEPNPGAVAVVGWGAYPADVWADTFSGAEFEVKTFWRTSWGVQTFQGFQLMDIYPPSSMDENETAFNTQDPAVVSKYFDVSFDEPIFLLGPAYPKFHKEWVRPITVTVKVSEDTPKGQYVIGIETGLPPEEYRSQWLMKYKLQYSDAAATAFSINRPHLRIIVTVQ